MRTALFLAISFASSSLFATPCSETPTWKEVIIPQMEKTKKIDQQGDEDFKKALDNFQKISKKDSKQMSAYALEILNKPELAKLQAERQSLGLKTLGLISGTDCKEIIENNKNLQSTISLQWAAVLTTIQADSQVYLAKSLSNGADISATTEAGKKVILHPNGTWSETPPK